MSLFGRMKAAVSGNAQANRLSTVSDNIANSSTTGCKASSTSLSSLVLPSAASSYNSGGVSTSVQYAISQQEDLTYTSSATDMAIKGDGFFIVQDASGTPYLTRAGDFAPDSNGNLVNAAGYTLTGYSYDSGAPSVVVNGFDGLVPVNTETQGLTTVASTTASLSGNLNSTSDVVTSNSSGDLPSKNLAPVTTDTKQTIAVDMSGFSQLASSSAANGNADGRAPSPVKYVTTGTDGIVAAQYEDGTSKSLYQIPLATVASPDNLTVFSGNVYSANDQSSVTVTGFPQSSGLGYIQSGALEGSNVDLTGELTTMIEAQKSYTTNSKVFQTGSDLMDVLVNQVR